MDVDLCVRARRKLVQRATLARRGQGPAVALVSGCRDLGEQASPRHATQRQLRLCSCGRAAPPPSVAASSAAVCPPSSQRRTASCCCLLGDGCRWTYANRYLGEKGTDGFESKEYGTPSRCYGRQVVG
ncbi:uncharacterized protein LOC124607022 [Schistocerca americana]|uniref:uncharacterized protein LOC124607022 n=1 Tax=Schistocerca americana TaxID=7009 RepID=UPI001F4F811C|nr:uncharacterized protein LOC124607022 [Schistocerca americana]